MRKMKKMFVLMSLLLIVFGLFGTMTASAQDEAAGSSVNLKDLNFLRAMALLGAGIAMGFGAIGPAIGEGYISGRAVEMMAQRPELGSSIFRTMLIGCAITESTGIYSLLISITLIFLAKS